MGYTQQKNYCLIDGDIMEKISLIIPVYNAQEYLERCLQSAVSQEYFNIEIICVDDGSTDDSGYILDDFAGKYRNIVAIHQENGGESRARNRGLSVATGDYIGFLDCDDWIEADMYSQLSAKLKEYNADMAVAGWIKEFPEHSIVMENQKKVNEGVIYQNELLKYVYHRDEYQGFAYMWNKLYKRKLLYDDNYKLIKFDENLMLGGDIVYLAEILMNVDKAVYIDRPFYHYRQRMESGSHSQNVYARIDSLTAYDHVIALFQKNSVSETILKFVKRFQVYHSTNIAEIAFETHNAEALNICHDYMKRYETEYVETNQGYQDRLERFYRIQKYKL